MTDEATPAPVRRARVTVRSEDYGNGWSATTDDEGRFVVRAIPAGRYTVQATKPAWVGGTYGATRPGRPGTPIPVADGQRVPGVTLRMSRGAVLTGIVLDHAGQPVPGVNVVAMRYVFQEVTGERVLSRAGADAVTDDQGTYRCYGLSPGDYLVMATLRAGSPIALLDLRPDHGGRRLASPGGGEGWRARAFGGAVGRECPADTTRRLRAGVLSRHG